jgi:hypothetical protein
MGIKTTKGQRVKAPEVQDGQKPLFEEVAT